MADKATRADGDTAPLLGLAVIDRGEPDKPAGRADLLGEVGDTATIRPALSGDALTREAGDDAEADLQNQRVESEHGGDVAPSVSAFSRQKRASLSVPSVHGGDRTLGVLSGQALRCRSPPLPAVQSARRSHGVGLAALRSAARFSALRASDQRCTSDGPS